MTVASVGTPDALGASLTASGFFSTASTTSVALLAPHPMFVRKVETEEGDRRTVILQSDDT